MALYKVNSGDLPLASDINQLADVFSGFHDIGVISLAPVLATPSAISGATAVAGSALGIGAYKYAVTLVTGYKKSNGTIVKTGETLASAQTSVTTTSGAQNVSLTGIPVGGNSVIARNIYRTKVGGSTLYYVGQVSNNTATTFSDSVTDANQGAAAPSSNTTGTTFGSDVVFNGAATFSGSVNVGTSNMTADGNILRVYGEFWAGDNTSGWTKITSANGASYIQAYNGAKTGSADLYFSGRLGAAGGNVNFTFTNINFQGTANAASTGTASATTTGYNSNIMKFQSSHWTGSAAVTYNAGLYLDSANQYIFYDYYNGRQTFQLSQGVIQMNDRSYSGAGLSPNAMKLVTDAGIFSVQDSSSRTWLSVSGNGMSYNGYNVYTEDYTKRTAVFAYRTTDFNVPAGVYTKINLTAKDIDTLGEMDTTTNYGRFTANNDGVYSIDTHMQMVAAGTGPQMFLVLYKNGALYVRLHSETYAQTSRMLGGSVNLHLNAGDYIEICGYCTQAATITGGLQYTYLTVARL